VRVGPLLVVLRIIFLVVSTAVVDSVVVALSGSAVSPTINEEVVVGALVTGTSLTFDVTSIASTATSLPAAFSLATNVFLNTV
jgi:hypothetical protein